MNETELKAAVIKKRVASRKWAQALAVTGALGSGKTEWVINLASGLASSGFPVVLADLDIINPYFCLRTVARRVARENLRVLTPPGDMKWGDLTYINPRVRTELFDKSHRTILDIGGDASGGLALKQFEPEIKEVGYDLHFVINPFRTHTRTLDEVASMKTKLESISGLDVTGVIASAHLAADSTAEECVRGSVKVKEFADALGLPMYFAMVEQRAFEAVQAALPDGIDAWPIERMILLPWEAGSSPEI